VWIDDARFAFVGSAKKTHPIGTGAFTFATLCVYFVLFVVPLFVLRKEREARAKKRNGEKPQVSKLRYKIV
jgi:hypothetical protein